MGKKFITILTHAKKYRVFSDDIKMVFKKPIRKTPPPPPYAPQKHTYADETEDSCISSEDLPIPLTLI
jgi:hypothetical protein